MSAPLPVTSSVPAAMPAHAGQPWQLRLTDARTHAALVERAPHLVEPFLRHLPRAGAAIVARLAGAAWREDVAGLRARGWELDTESTEPPAQPQPHAEWHADGALVATLRRARPGRWAVAPLPDGGLLALPVLARHAFDRLHVGQPVLHLPGRRPEAVGRGAARPHRLTHPDDLVAVLSRVDAGGVATGTRPNPAWPALGAEVADATANLALALARSEQAGRTARSAAAVLGARDCVELARLRAAQDPVVEPAVFLERLCTEGHTLHPCARTRLGMGTAALLRHDVEATGPTDLVLVALRRGDVESAPDADGRDVGELLLDEYPELAAAVAAAGLDRADHVFLPVHAWQLDHVVRVRHAGPIAAGEVVPVPAARLRAEPTVSLRTLLTEPSPAGRRYFVKTALDVQVTSTCRTISVQTATNGPVFSALLDEIVAADPALRDRVVALPELAGASYRGDRSLTALVRAGLDGLLRPEETAVPGCALYARSPLSDRDILAELVDRYAAQRDEPRPDLAALLFLDEYATLLLGAVLRLMTRYGIGLEAHLQNTVPTFVDGVPTRVVFRDWGGLRVYLPRLHHRGHQPAVRADSLTTTSDVAVMRAKVAYTTLQNNLAEVVLRLGRSHRLDETAGWARVRAVARAVLADLAAEADGTGDLRLAGDTAADAAALFAPRLPHKALLSMRLYPDDGDRYVEVDNPLWEAT